jgi:hypothetical protein
MPDFMQETYELLPDLKVIILECKSDIWRKRLNLLKPSGYYTYHLL